MLCADMTRAGDSCSLSVPSRGLMRSICDTLLSDEDLSTGSIFNLGAGAVLSSAGATVDVGGKS